jgi:hypothetical protein
LNSFEWNDLIDEEEKIEVSIDEVRSEWYYILYFMLYIKK